MRTTIPLLVLFIIFLTGVVNAQTPVTFSSKTDFTTGTDPNIVSVGDFNGDGKPDMAVTNFNSSSVSVFMNTTPPGASTPTFSSKTDFITGTAPSSVSIGDFNGDGKLDLAVANANSSSVSVLLNTTTPGATTPAFSTRTDFTTVAGPISISIGDFNGDGKLDLVVANPVPNSVSVLLNTTPPGASTPTFSSKTDFITGSSPEFVSIGDLNGDGKPDMAVTNFNSSSVSVFLNTTSPGASIPTFSSRADFTTGDSPNSVSIGDLNGDGKPDLAVANRFSSSVSVFLNTTIPGNAIPTFSSKTDFTTGSLPEFVSIGDLNGDGRADFAVANTNSVSVSVFLNITPPGASTPTFSSKTDFTTGVGPLSVSVNDFNGDGLPDLAVANTTPNTVSVLLNTTNIGTPSVSYNVKADFATGSRPRTVSIGDINGDGKLDLAVTNELSNSVSVFLNTTTPGAATPTFFPKTDFTTGTGPWSVSSGDINGDGKLDLAVTNLNSNSVSVFLNTTIPGANTPTFSTKADFTTGTGPFSVSIGDLNGDGKPDLAVANWTSKSVSVLLNTTTPGANTPTFSTKTDFTTGTGPYSVSIGDLNGDGLLDLAVANRTSNSVSVLFNTTTPGATTPTFLTKTDFNTGGNPQSVSIGDLNGDGKPDLAVGNLSSNSVSVFLNTTTPGANTPTFSTKTDFNTGTGPFSVSIGDINGDGKPDLTVANQNSNSVSVFLNTTSPGAGAPAFSARTDFNTLLFPGFVAIGDINGDGKPDLVVTNSGSDSVSILLNTTIVTGIKEVKNFIPTDYTLQQNYPNPFNPSTNISFSIPNEAFVTLIIYDVLGREVVQLVNRQLKTGNYNFSFDAASGSNRITSGVYFYRLTATSSAVNFVETKKMILLK